MNVISNAVRDLLFARLARSGFLALLEMTQCGALVLLVNKAN